MKSRYSSLDDMMLDFESHIEKLKPDAFLETVVIEKDLLLAAQAREIEMLKQQIHNLQHAKSLKYRLFVYGKKVPIVRRFLGHGLGVKLKRNFYFLSSKVKKIAAYGR